MNNWYYAAGNARHGPVSEFELQELARTGVIKDNTLVWREGFPDWRPWSQAKGALGADPAAPPAADGAADDDTAICAYSGRRFPRSRMLPIGDQWIGAEYRDEYFQKLREGGVVFHHLVPASLLQRFGARFVDITLLALALAIPDLLVENMRPGMSLHARQVAEFVLYALNLIVPALYTTCFLASFGATPGKMLFKVKVVRPDGSPLTKGRALGRHFADIMSGLFFGIGYLVALGNPERKTLHDIICDTRVVSSANEA